MIEGWFSMDRKRTFVISLAIAVLLGLSWASFAAPVGKDDPPAQKPVKISLPKTLYCTMVSRQDRYTINLRPLTKALGEPTETWEVQLFHNDHLVTSLGKIGGGMKLEDFIIFTLLPVDADAFNSIMTTPGDMAGGSEDVMRSKTGRNFQLRVLNAAGDLLAKKKVLLLLN